MTLTNPEQRQIKTARLFTYEEPDAEADISASLHGAKAIGKGAFSALRSTQFSDDAQVKAEQKIRDKESETLIERIAAWGRMRTMVGGIEMTNDEALASLQHVNQNGQSYADWAVQQGLIREGEQEEFIRVQKRREELMRLEQQGLLTDAQRREKEALDNSRLGQAGQNAQAEHYKNHGVALTQREQEATINTQLRSTGSVASTINDNVFQSSPKLSSEFSAAQAATEPLDVQKPEQSIQVAQVSRDIKATGLDI